MCSKDTNFTQKLDLFGETLFFYPVANTFSQTGCQIPKVLYELNINYGNKEQNQERKKNSVIFQRCYDMFLSKKDENCTKDCPNNIQKKFIKH